jgi:hypothetical protein
MLKIWTYTNEIWPLWPTEAIEDTVFCGTLRYLQCIFKIQACVDTGR